MVGEIEIAEVGFAAFLTEIRSVRFAVFVEEQGVPADLEMDEWDERSRHVLATTNGLAIGTGRLLPDGHIGRVAVLKEWRGRGVGVLMMKRMLEMGTAAGMRRIELSAQTRVVPFYEQFGFKVSGGAYFEAGIEHIKMVLMS